MARTTEQILQEQETQAAADSMRPKPPMPEGLTASQREQWDAWGWHDHRARAKARHWFHGYRESVPAQSGDEEEEAMSLGKRKTSSAGYDPIVKIDCRDGTITRCDRVQVDGEWQTTPVEIEPQEFEAVFDMPNLKIGWLCFSPPDFKFVNVGEDVGEQPTDKHKEGFKLRVLLRNDSGEGVHELASTAAAMWQSMDELHDSWEDTKGKHKNQLPVVGISEMVKVQTRSGTSYRPSFTIKSWVPVPPALAIKPAATKAKRKAAQQPDDEPILFG
jgi:hypothetical protein